MYLPIVALFLPALAKAERSLVDGKGNDGVATSAFVPNTCENRGGELEPSAGNTVIPCSAAIDPSGLDFTEFPLGQTGGDVSCNANGGLEVPFVPITVPFDRYVSPDGDTMCPINIHFHIGAEHNSDLQYDQPFENGVNGPTYTADEIALYPFLADPSYSGKRCDFYRNYEDYGLSKKDVTTTYNFKYCDGVKVGETYEFHWPHSTLGACGDTNDQWNTPFNDGLVCLADPSLSPGEPVPLDPIILDLVGTQALADNLGVQAQVVTIVNTGTDRYYFPNFFEGMLVNKALGLGQDITAYTGSRTGATFGDQPGDERCDAASPVSWQVDRKCHLLSATALDEMCKEIKTRPGMRRCGTGCDNVPEKYRFTVTNPYDVNEGDSCCYPDAIPGTSRGVVNPALISDNVRDATGTCPEGPGATTDTCNEILKKKNCLNAEGCTWQRTNNGNGNTAGLCLDINPVTSASNLHAEEAAVKEQPNSGFAATAAWVFLPMATLWSLLLL